MKAKLILIMLTLTVLFSMGVNAQVEILNMNTIPLQVYTNQSFIVDFDLINTGNTSEEVSLSIVFAQKISDTDSNVLDFDVLDLSMSNDSTNETNEYSYNKEFSTSSVVGEYILGIQVVDSQGTEEIFQEYTINAIARPAPEQPKLIVKDVTVRVDGDKENGADETGGTIDKDVMPGSEISVKIELENLFEDIDIEDIEIEGRLEDIDDGADLVEDAEINEIKDGKDEEVELVFNVPEEVDEGDYTLRFEIEGEDEDGKTHFIDLVYTVEVEKEKHKIKITEADLSRSIVSCDKETRLLLDILNIGEDDEEEVVIRVTNDDLDLYFEETDIELESGIDDDNDYSVTIPIDLRDAKVGTYSLEVSVYYDDNDLTDEKTLDLTVRECDEYVAPVVSVTQNKPVVTKPKPVKVQEEVSVAYTSSMDVAPTVMPEGVAVAGSINQAETTSSFRDSSAYTTLLIVLFLLVIGGGVLLIGYMLGWNKR